MLQDVHDIERAKWDGVAARERPDQALLVQDADFGAYCRRLSAMVGVEEFLGDLRGKEVLEYSCGLGTMSTLLARSGARVSALDISPGSVAVARRRAQLHGVDDRIEFVVAAAERLPFDAGRFDVAVGRAVLHHLEVRQAGPELHRVLGAGGRAAFSEPMGTNPVIAFARGHLPYPGKNPRGADVPLGYEDIAAWSGRSARRTTARCSCWRRCSGRWGSRWRRCTGPTTGSSSASRGSGFRARGARRRLARGHAVQLDRARAGRRGLAQPPRRLQLRQAESRRSSPTAGSSSTTCAASA
jgi:SAM-dependent methyltransferase